MAQPASPSKRRPKTGGPPISSYTVTAKDLTDPARGGQTASGKDSPITVGGLANGDSYTLAVTATNVGGAGPASSPSNAVMPRAYIYVTGDANVNKYGPGGNAPIAAIKGPNTELQFPTGLAFGPSGNLFTAATTGGGVNEYAKGATGDASPIARIRGVEPGGIAVDATGNLVVAYPHENSVTEYAKTAPGASQQSQRSGVRKQGSIIPRVSLWMRPGTYSSPASSAAR